MCAEWVLILSRVIINRNCITEDKLFRFKYSTLMTKYQLIHVQPTDVPKNIREFHFPDCNYKVIEREGWLLNTSETVEEESKDIIELNMAALTV
ncbi:Hypothetical predicted protein [Octopus vulgaris]|uniref:Uncharacterized protein n=1 Tax=Octopus vulgaris TaxID=6645 RepID=A0AA36BLS3_OCTVU|nr:Hypothetical predicted protein [Octopus vulgaris]